MDAKLNIWFGVLQYNDTENHKTIDTETLRKYLDNNDCIKFYAFILHNQDIDDDGILKTPHYHIFIELHSNYSKNTLITDISSKLFINRNIVSFKPCYDVKKSCRYLCHEDNKEKYPYDYDSIITNNPFTLDEYRLYGNGTNLDVCAILCIIDQCDTLSEVYGTIGIKNAVKYRHIINDMFKEKFIKKGD